jgi:regulator of replication initiation timing
MSSARMFPIPTIQTNFVECAAQEIDEKQVEPGEKDVNIKEVKQQLKKAQHVIAQLYQENGELKRKLAERTLEAQAPQSKAGQRSPTSPT